MDSLPPLTVITPLSLPGAVLPYHRKARQCPIDLRREKPKLYCEASASCDRGNSTALNGRTVCVFAPGLPCPDKSGLATTNSKKPYISACRFYVKSGKWSYKNYGNNLLYSPYFKGGIRRGDAFLPLKHLDLISHLGFVIWTLGM